MKDRYIVFEFRKGYGVFKVGSFDNESQAMSFANNRKFYFAIDMKEEEGLLTLTDKWK